MARERRQITVGFVALGCPKNVVDSERMLAEIAKAGLLINAEPDNADVVVINTCGFIEPARTESLAAIKHAVDCKLTGTVKKVIVAGCLCERLGRELFNQAKGIDAVVGLSQRDNIAKIIKKLSSFGGPSAYLDQASPRRAGRVADDRSRLLITPGHWAYLRISEGCDRRCSFCTIPAIRGPFRSKPQELVLAEAAELVSAGAVELNLIAQDTTYYGHDLGMKNGLAGLMGRLEENSDLVWIRLMYLYAAGISDKLIETISQSKKVVRYLDVAIQHANNTILQAMRRPDTKDRLQRLIEKLRREMSDIILRTTLIVGFPGETDRQFDELLDFVRWAKFDALGCFKFCRESGTDAAEMPAQVPEKVKEQRREELMLTQQAVAFARNRDRIGSRLTCLVDSVDADGLGRGRFYGQAPDIDGVCIVNNCPAMPGRFIEAEVVGTRDYDLLVEPVGDDGRRMAPDSPPNTAARDETGQI